MHGNWFGDTMRSQDTTGRFTRRQVIGYAACSSLLMTAASLWPASAGADARDLSALDERMPVLLQLAAALGRASLDPFEREPKAIRERARVWYREIASDGERRELCEGLDAIARLPEAQEGPAALLGWLRARLAVAGDGSAGPVVERTVRLVLSLAMPPGRRDVIGRLAAVEQWHPRERRGG